MAVRRHEVSQVNAFLFRICGRINTVPDFQWYVENQQPENVTITLRHAGLNDGFAEGLGFTLSGEKRTHFPMTNSFSLQHTHTQVSAFPTHQT